MNHPLLLVLLTLAGAYVAWLWRADLHAALAGNPPPNPLPGASPATVPAVAIAITGVLLILGVETAGEFAFDLADQQSRMTWLFAAYSIVGAPVIEELIFRGWLVIENRGRAALWAGALVASALFALLHPFLWQWDDAGFRLTATPKGWFSTAIVFAMSMWLYFARFSPWNPQRSLLPCFAAHACKNIGVVAIKASAGFMAGLW
ncbi:MAG: CPBP family intramembrane metalloprotease [Opitutaceae bacterium]|nr:CPBP family intramembrane metalloprotease [Opitutaceae bacterium]